MALNNANRPLDDMMEVHINAAVRALAPDTSKLKTLLFGLQYKNPLLLAWLRRRYSKKSDDSLFQSVLPVLDNVIREFAQNRPRFEDF